MSKLDDLMESMAGLRPDQQVRYLIYKIGEYARVGEGPELDDYWPELPATEQADRMPEEIARRAVEELAAELVALRMLGDRAGEAITLEDKCLQYVAAIDRLREHLKLSEWQRPTTWEEFRRIIAREVLLGPYGNEEKARTL